jgi:hypothetical protein
MANYDVVPGPNGAWSVKRKGASRASAIAATQIEAQKVARGYAARTGGGEVRIHGGDGQIRNTNTIGKPDPSPPRDRVH